MIAKREIRKVSEKYLRETLKEAPKVIKVLTHPDRYPYFIDALYLRTNQLDTAGYIRSKYALNQWVMSATNYYARTWLQRLEPELMGKIKAKEKMDAVQAVPGTAKLPPLKG